MITLLIAFLAGAIISAISTFFICRNNLTQKIAILNEKLQVQNNGMAKLENEKQLLQADKEKLLMNLTANEFKLIAVNDKLATQKIELEGIADKFKFEFKNLAQNILEEKSEKFTLLNEEKMKAILDPLKSDIGEFKQKVQDTYDKESKERFSLEREVGKLIQMTQQVSLEANNLTSALKGNNKIQGNWGELILESLLENSGLTKGREYFTQQFIRDRSGNVVKDENGNALQPDITICYPDERKIIIDSKVSLNAWEECISHEKREDQQRCLKEHIISLRRHIDGLSRKNYPKYALALDYVLLFIPIEPAFLEAVKTDLLLWKYAYEKKILLVSPTNLFAVLKIIADLWKVEQQNRNAIDIANKAGALYDKFFGFLENFQLVGKKIEEANLTYESALKQLSTGRGNIVGRVEELKQIGASASKQLPDKLLEQSLQFKEG